jgi:hypothetical protein
VLLEPVVSGEFGMEKKKIISVMGALTALAAPEAVQAAPAAMLDVAHVLHAQSYQELLTPIPNAVALLRAVDALPAPTPDAVEQVQYYDHHHHHNYHHHHHHNYYHHHHHHHHHGYYDAPPYGYYRPYYPAYPY